MFKRCIIAAGIYLSVVPANPCCAQQIMKCAQEPTQVAYEEVYDSAHKQFNSNSNVLAVTFTLPTRMYITIVGNGSVQLVSPGGDGVFTTGVYSFPEPGSVFTGSYRRGKITEQGGIAPLTTSFTGILDPGTYTYYWNIWVSGFTLQLDSANLTVHAVPCSMGGTIPQPSVIGVNRNSQ